ncbi:MAG: T9SS type A sorting domain-containing protein [Candidatus Latescibacterota bacterium]|nr:T9SS type A sorting domain-containing protein [Candidatus Latescibacterota bacterium]
MIEFALPRDDEVRLSIYNIAGQKAATLIRGGRQADHYSLHWDGRDGNGTYFHQLRTESRLKTRKLLLIR